MPRLRVLRAALKVAFSASPRPLRRNTDWLARLSAWTCPHRLHRRLLWARGAATTLPPCHIALSSGAWRIRQGATSSRERLSPALAPTFRPGSSTVPSTLAVMCRTVRSSMTMTP
jgi:hypothetical protein